MKNVVQSGLCALLFLVSCDWKEVEPSTSDAFIRIHNKTEHTITGISLFSLSFDDLEAGEKTEFQLLNFDGSEDDPVIYASSENQKFVKYLIPDTSWVGRYTYTIDSLNFEKRAIYVNSQKEQ